MKTLCVDCSPGRIFVVHVIGCFVCVRASHVWCVCVCVCCTCAKRRVCEWASERLDPSSLVLRRPLCRFKSCPSEPANSSCSIFIKPLSLKEPYPDHGKSHSSRSRSHALSILALIPLLLPALLSLSLSLTRSLSPPFTSLVYLSLPPSLSPSLPLCHTHTHTHTHSLTYTQTLSLSHTYIHKHTHTTHTCSHTRAPTQSIRVQHTCAGWGERCRRGFFASVVSEGAVPSFGEEAGSQLFSLSSSSHSWNAKTGLMDISELCLPDPLSYHNQ